MLPTPRKYFLTASGAEGKDMLTAFDKALLLAGIGNINLIRVSSILPPGAEYDDTLFIPAGSLVPTAYGYTISQNPGERIAAAIGVGFASTSFGVIMEFAGICSEEEARNKIRDMLTEAMINRGAEIVDMRIVSVEHKVERIGCVLAAAPMWY